MVEAGGVWTRPNCGGTPHTVQVLHEDSFWWVKRGLSTSLESTWTVLTETYVGPTLGPTSQGSSSSTLCVSARRGLRVGKDLEPPLLGVICWCYGTVDGCEIHFAPLGNHG